MPFTRVENLDLTVLGAGQEEVDVAIDLSSKFPGSLDAASVMENLDAVSSLVLTHEDGRRLANRLVEFRSRRLNKGQTVYLTLREIDAPSHYSKITECHNTRYPRNATSEHNVHAILCRQGHGVVWTGMRGTFALREWGFEKPEPIFDSVARIVEELHAKTGRPVPMVAIEAEIGKYRRVVNLKSVAIAAHCNPKLRRIGSDSFVPAEVTEEPAEISNDELDSILAQFERRVSAR